MNELFNTISARVGRIGADPADDEDIQLQKNLLVIVTIPNLILPPVWGLIYIIFGEPIAGAIPITYATISLFSLITFGFTRQYQFFRFSQLTLFLLLPFFLMAALGGFVNSSGVIFLVLDVPPGSITL